MNAKQTKVSQALNVAGVKVANVAKSAKRASEAHPTSAQMVTFCVAAFADYLTADATLQNAKALWDAARMGLRTELSRAYRIIGAGHKWDAFKADVRAALVKARVCATPKEAGRLINNALIALNLTGNGARKGGKRKGAGRKEVTETGSVKHGDAARICAAALAYIAEAQQRHAGDSEMLDELGAIAAILGGVK